MNLTLFLRLRPASTVGKDWANAARGHRRAPRGPCVGRDRANVERSVQSAWRSWLHAVG